MPPVYVTMRDITRRMQVPVETMVRITEAMIEETVGVKATVLTDFLTARAASKEEAIAKAAGEALSTDAVGKLLRVGKAAIHRAKDEGRLLTYKEPGKRTFLFPVFQFDGAVAAPWVLEVVDLVGNGFAALHFLTVERKSLKGASYLTRLKNAATPNERAARIEELFVAARRLLP